MLVSLLSLLSLSTLSSSLQSFYLNKNLPLQSDHCTSCPQPECLYTTRPFNLTRQITFCFRYRPDSILLGQGSYGWVSLAKMATNMSDVVGGVVLSRWREGTWMGMKTRGYVGQRNKLWWVRVGEGAGQNILGWKHVCLSLDWGTGDVFLIENGEILFNERVRSVAKAWQNMDSYVDTFTVGCFHGYGYVSTRGPVADFHLYSRNLYMEEMVKFTTCSNTYPIGNIINWNTATWILQTQNNKSEELETDLTDDVCAVSSTMVIPTTSVTSDPCHKISGRMIAYHTQEELDMIARQVSRMSNIVATRRGQCMSQVPGSNNTVTTVLPTAIRKSESNVWTNMLTMLEVEYLPWAEDRPNILEDEYKCVFLHVVMQPLQGSEFANVLSVNITGVDFFCIFVIHFSKFLLFTKITSVTT